MDGFSRLGNLLTEPRFAANLIAVHAVILVIVIVSLCLRRLMTHGGNRLKHWTGLEKLEAVGKEVARHGHTLLFWITVAALASTLLGGLGYHLLGRDIRLDLVAWYEQLTVEDFFLVGLVLGELLALLAAASVAVRALHRLLPYLEKQVRSLIGNVDKEEALHRCIVLFERFAVVSLRLATLWCAAHIAGFGTFANVTIGFVVRVLAILAVARLLTLASRTISRVLADQGDLHLGKGHFRRYWERITRLFPFGERCFEAAVYISAASLCVRELHFIAFVADFGPRIVECIGIFFCTRVVIELLQVLLHEAFGLYATNRPIDQKGRTLVPLLHSLCQYVLYFGSIVVMMGVLGVDTRPILAGAGILGLAVGLGAQSLVTDVVSGFFILFEGQYLVGDYIHIGEATGTVEAVGIRLTQIRDGQGKLHIIPNGQIKGVVSYSKGYVNAVVDYRVPAGADLEALLRAMTEAGRRLRQARSEVLADTDIHGLIDMGTADMTVRAVTRVKPGTHGMMQSAYRQLLKEVLDQKERVSRPALAA